MATDFDTVLHQPLLDAEGVAAVWTDADGTDHAVTVIPPIAESKAEGDGDYQVMVREIKIGGLESAFTGIKQGEQIAVGGKTYKVLYPDPDETGWVDIYVERA